MSYKRHNNVFLIVLTILLLFPIHTKSATSKKHSFNPFKNFLKKKDQNNTRKDEENGNSKEKIQHTKKDIYQWLTTLSEVVSLVEKKAFRDVDFPTFIQESLKAAVPQVDAHSAFFSPKSYKETIESTSGEFSGIGISIISKAPEDDVLVIIDVIEGGPSDKEGLKGGDKIIEVGGEKLRGLATDEVINKLKGRAGTQVELKIIRNKKPLEFKIKRDIIKDQTSLSYYFKKQNVYYLSLKLFTETASKEMSKLLQKANEGKCKGIILDLRRNPGGILDSAVEMAGLFLDKDSLVVSTKDKTRKVITEYFTKTNPVFNSDVPIFILIDNFTASASEILAGTLQHYSQQSFTQSDKKKKNKKLMVFLVGTPTFGKGSVQEVIPISNGSALKLTTMLYFLPNEKSIQAIGIKPDFTINPKTTPTDEIKWINELYGKETSLKHHITVEEVEGKASKLKEKKKKQEDEEKEKSWEERQMEAINKDVQIKAGVNLINILHITKKNNPKLVKTRAKALAFLKENYLDDDMVELEKVK